MQTCFNICFLHITNMQSVGVNTMSKMNLDIGHFTLNAMLQKAKTCHIELKIKHVSDHISTYAELVWVFTHLAH